MKKYDRRLQMVEKARLKQYKGKWIPANQTQNLPRVHQQYKQKIPSIKYRDIYWRDALPAAVRLEKVVTGTYNFPGTYKIVYRVNNTGDYRTLADNLNTSRSYTLAASPAALGLGSNECVTEIMFVFGQAPAGFSQVDAPMLYCTAVSGLTAGSSFVNVADVGGTYNGVWIQAVTRWVTTVYGKSTELPKTGF